MSTLMEQLSELVMNDETDGMVELLVHWPTRDDDWLTAVEVRICAAKQYG
ncbi:MAG: hypothetical protein AAF702_39085 [Chloroflexota bacterium]